MNFIWPMVLLWLLRRRKKRRNAMSDLRIKHLAVECMTGN